MKFEVDTDTILEKITTKMLSNLAENAKAQGLTEEEVNATVVLNKKKITQDAQNIAVFVTGLYVTPPAEPVSEESYPE